MTRQFEDFMRNHITMIIFLRWDTIAYLKYLESHYDEEIYESVYRLLEAIDNLLEFYQVRFGQKTEKDFPEDMFEKSRISHGIMSYVSRLCEKYGKIYGDRWSISSGMPIDDVGSCSDGNALFGDIYLCLHRISGDCERLLKYDNEIEEKA